jgi:hypothetical protein
VKVALSQWPGHMALVLGNGGLTTQPGSAAANEGLDMTITFIEDAPSKNKALQNGDVDFVWQTVDELPVNLGAFKTAGVDARAFVQIDWSRGGDACIATKEVKTVEDVFGKQSATLLFSPDHTVFEFMITNSRLTREQVARVRQDTKFSPDDWTYARILFAQGKVDVACLWEPDVTIALQAKPGSHRPVLDRGRHRAGGRRAAGPQGLPRHVLGPGGQGGPGAVRGRQDGRCGQAGRARA